MKSFGGVLRFTAILLLLQSCSWKAHSRGAPGSLLIVADPEDRAVVAGALKDSFSRTIQTPQDEPLFRITDVQIDKLDDYGRAPIVLMVAALDSDSPTARYIKRMLSGDVLAGIETGNVCFFQQLDPWASSQLLLILIGRNKIELESNAARWFSPMVEVATDFEIIRLQDGLFRRGKREAIHSLPNHPAIISVYIPDGYAPVQSADSLCIIQYQEQAPPRWVTISWREEGALDSISEHSLLAWRRQVNAHYDKTVTSFGSSTTEPDRWFAGRRAICIRGLWQSAAYGDGGPYTTYAFHDSVNHLSFLVDYALFAPGKEKVPYLWQLDAVAQTFTLKLPKE